MRVAIVALTVWSGILGLGVGNAEPAKLTFSAKPAPLSGPAQIHGSYAKGCLAGAVELAETGIRWQAMRLSRNRNWGHPAVIAFVERLSREASQEGWPRLYIGDISQPRGGPMNGGHRSHQIGLDADIWLRIPTAKALSRGEREMISSHSMVRPDRLGVNKRWSKAHHAVLRAAARDPAVARIFVNAAIKRALCAAEPPGKRAWLRKVRAWWGHDAHFHVRLHCPEGAENCVSQAPPPPGDGCDDELAWWFTDEAMNPKPSPKPKRDLTLADLPKACRAIATR